jgi:AcrR family transcriptional regulator
MPRAEREQLILDIAGQVFAHDGYHAAAMDEIARLAGISKPMLYAYFGSKEGLYVAYIERTGQELLERLQRAFPEPEPALRMRARVSEFFAFVEEHEHGWRVLFTEASANRPVADEVAQLRGRIASAVSRLVREAAGSGLIDDLATDVIGQAIVGAGESVANWWLAHRDVPRERVVGWYAAVIEGAVAGVARGPAAP